MHIDQQYLLQCTYPMSTIQLLLAMHILVLPPLLDDEYYNWKTSFHQTCSSSLGRSSLVPSLPI